MTGNDSDWRASEAEVDVVRMRLGADGHPFGKRTELLGAVNTVASCLGLEVLQRMGSERAVLEHGTGTLGTELARAARSLERQRQSPGPSMSTDRLLNST